MIRLMILALRGFGGFQDLESYFFFFAHLMICQKKKRNSIFTFTASIRPAPNATFTPKKKKKRFTDFFALELNIEAYCDSCWR